MKTKIFFLMLIFSNFFCSQTITYKIEFDNFFSPLNSYPLTKSSVLKFSIEIFPPKLMIIIGFVNVLSLRIDICNLLLIVDDEKYLMTMDYNEEDETDILIQIMNFGS
jgi:hypothetical protein